MNEKTWHRIFKDFIECYEAIHVLVHRNIADNETCDELRANLLENIIETFKSEVED